MKDLHYFPDFADYREDALARFDPQLREHPFYRRLIDYVLLHRSPIFYRISEGREHFSFSGAYHFQTDRDYAECENSALRRSLFLIHDFTHLLFPYPHNISGVSLKQFTEIFTYQERLASSESEIMIYYRMPELRQQVFTEQTLYYDLLQHTHPSKPDAQWLLEHRNRLVLDQQFAEQHLGEHPDILRFFRKWSSLTPTWCAERYQTMLSRPMPSFNWQRMSAADYEQRIQSFVLPSDPQPIYQRNLLRNIALGWGLLQRTNPPTMSQLPQAFASLQGEAFWPEDQRVPAIA